MNLSLGFLHRIRTAMAIAAAAVAALGLLAYLAIDRMVTDGQRAHRGDEQLLELQHTRAGLAQAQAELREFLLTGLAADRARFDATVEGILRTEAGAQGPLTGVHAELHGRLRQHVALLRSAAEARARGDLQAALATLRSEPAQRLEAAVAVALQQQQAQAGAQRAEAQRAPHADRARVLVFGGTLLLVALFAWVTHVLRVHERERRGQQERLDTAEALRRAVTVNMADGMLTASADLRVLDVNESALQLLGYSRDELVGRELSSVVAAEAPGAGSSDPLPALLASPEPFRRASLQGLGLHKDGRLVPLRISVNDVQVGGQRLLAMLIQDMTQIQRATEALHASETQLRQIADALPVMIAEIDQQQRLRFHNRALAAFLGRGAGELRGRSLREAFGDDMYEEFRPHLERAMAGEGVQFERSTVNGADADGALRHFHIQLLPRLSHRGQVVGCYGYATDITALKRIDRMKTEFVSIVSHELRTPLTSIRGSLGLIAGGVAGALPEPVVSLVAIAKNNCDRLVRLINDILDIEKIASGKLALRLQRLDLGALVRQAVAANEGFAAQHGAQLRLEVEPQPLLVRADSDRLVQVLTNLLSNAVKFSPAGGEVGVRVAATADGVRVEVADQGPGIPPEFQQHIFQKFSQADSSDTRRSGGTGLGLNISRTLLEKMGGHIGFASPPGAGATFFFELPRWEDAPPVDSRVQEEADGDAGLPRILHLEDDADLQHIVATLTRDCARCISVATLQDARTQLRTQRFDLVLLDLDLGGASGWDLLEDIGRLRPPPPVIVFSASDADAAAGRPVQAMLIKSQTSEAELLQAIRRVLPAPAAAA